MKKQQQYLLSSSLLSTVLLGTPMLSHAAGFALVEQSVNGLGNAYAGSAAIAEDATTVFTNPAGMTQLSKTSFSAAIHAITPSAKFSDAGSVVTTGGDGGDAGGTNIVPNVYFVTDMGNNAKFGLGINAPFGLSTKYDDGWRGRYHAVESEVTTININPAVAFSTDYALSFGFGVNIQYMDATLTNAVDFGTICQQLENATLVPPGTCSPLGVNLTPRDPGSDGFSEINGDSLTLGYNFGVLFAPSDKARVGFAYRSKIDHRLEGTADFTVPTRATSVFGAAFADTDAAASATLPEFWALSGYQQIAENWELLGEITYTKWSRLQKLVIEFENPAKGDSVEQLKFRNTYRYSLGANYKPNDRFTYRIGYAFDEGAAQNAETRTPRIPDQDRMWLSLGFGYKHNKMSFDVGYAHLFIDDAPINRESATGDVIRGNYELSVDIISAQFNYAL